MNRGYTMLSSQKPKLIPVAFATSGAKQDIPVTSQISIAAGRASYTDGFPPLTRTPLAAGGIPPYGTDFNGVLNDITAAIRWANAGMGYAYNADFSTSVGGYPKGAQLTKATNDGIWLNTVESNASNPDTGGAGWLDLTAGRLIGTRSITSSGTYTPSPGVKKIRITMCGGGGGGGGCQAADNTQTYSGAGGGAGGTIITMFALTGATNYPVVIGSGGAGGNGAANGADGGATTIASFVAVGGGGAGKSNVSNTAGGSGGVPLSGDIRIAGGYGNDGQSGLLFLTGSGGASYFGGGGRSGAGAGAGGGGVNGSAYGSGGGGAYDPAYSGLAGRGGNGAAGVVIIEEFS
jgi:hypothetical protein